MANTARTKKEEIEYFDPPDVLDQKILKLANMIKTSKHFTVFTGAGISTSAGIPDFRSGLNTVLDTGAGAWAKAAAVQKGVDVTPKKKLKIKSTLQAIPTATHMALVEMNQRGVLKCLISQNCDGLHRRSGFDPNCLSELHGNTNLEFCKKCGKQYLRDFRTRSRNKRQSVHDHRTGRTCTVKGCDGVLLDSIINFGENLHDYAWDPAEANATQSDCCLVLGSSLTVTPAADLPEMVGEKDGATFCVVNLQKTPMDDLCDVRIYAKCDDVMQALLQKLNLTIPAWKLQRFIDVDMDATQHRISVFGIDSDGTAYDILSEIKLSIKGHDKVYEKSGSCLDGAVFEVDKTVPIANAEMCLELGFMRRYNEPNLMLDLRRYLQLNGGGNAHCVLDLKYCPYQGSWEVSKNGSPQQQEQLQNDVDDVKQQQQQQEMKESIYVGNLHELKSSNKAARAGQNCHVWTMIVSTEKDKLVVPQSIEQVEYELHPTFNPSRVIVKEAPFYLRRTGWGTFDVRAKIVFKKEAKRKPVQCSHGLDFDHPVTLTAFDETQNDDNESQVFHMKEIEKFQT